VGRVGSFTRRSGLWRRAILAASLGSLLPCAAFAQSDLIFADGFETTGPPYLQLVINEVDYDNLGTDAHEFVEIFNPGPAVVPLSDLSMMLFNGDNSLPYGTVALGAAGTLAAGQYFVVASNTVTVAPGALVFRFPMADNNIQNGPDGLLLIHDVLCVAIDALSYEGSLTAAVTPSCGTVSLVEGSAATVADNNTASGSLIRNPNGFDTDDAATDWAFTSTLTPGFANTP
jgi:large repetitive protein